MSKGGGKNPTPVGLKKPSKGSHSEKSTVHKACWFARCEDAPKGEKWIKFSSLFVPGCVPCTGNEQF